MIDLHSHILPGIDDGSASPAESAQLLTISRQQGVTDIFATPHFYAMEDHPDEFLARREKALEAIDWDEKTMPRIHLGAEVAYFTGMSHSQKLRKLQLGNTGLLLVEMPFTLWTERIVEEVCDLQRGCGLVPVLAHVERYRRLGQLPKYRQRLLAEGVLFQSNAVAFCRGNWAMGLLKKGNIHFLGSDCHNLTSRPPRLSEAAEHIGAKLGRSTLDRLNDYARTAIE